MKKDELKFRIDQLRKDKQIYALESIAVTFILELAYFLLSIVLGRTSSSLALLFLFPGLAYFAYMAIGNLKRYKEIKKLEKKLYR